MATLQLSDGDELLFRQVHPSFMEDGQPSSQPFRPSSQDDGRMSVDRSTLTTAADAYARYTAAGLASEGVFGLTVGEFEAEEVTCWSDPLRGRSGRAPNPAHALADYTKHTPRQQKNLAKRLKRKAIQRGRLFPQDL